jgi:hypothetical protein
MTDSPSTVEPKQLRDLHIELKAAKKDMFTGTYTNLSRQNAAPLRTKRHAVQKRRD